MFDKKSPSQGWRDCAPLKEKRESHAMVAYNTEIFVFGGWNGTTRLASCEKWVLQLFYWHIDTIYYLKIEESKLPRKLASAFFNPDFSLEVVLQIKHICSCRYLIFQSQITEYWVICISRTSFYQIFLKRLKCLCSFALSRIIENARIIWKGSFHKLIKSSMSPFTFSETCVMEQKLNNYVYGWKQSKTS